MIFDFIHARLKSLLILARLGSLWAILAQGTTAMQAQTNFLNVTNFGAKGDAVPLLVNTVSNSAAATVPPTSPLSSADIGKLFLIFGAGPATSPTNNQDLIATITAVSRGTNITMSAAAGRSFINAQATCGTQNATAFQNCVNACTGTNTIISIPAGRFLLVPPAQLTNFSVAAIGWPSSVILQKGGIHFLGAGRTNTTLLGCGAWRLQGTGAVRGWMFSCEGPVTNNYPLEFDSLTMDGGVTSGNTTNHGFPASIVDGSGWDETHDAVVDSGPGTALNTQIFNNCTFTHWRGEMVKSVTSAVNGFIEITNCIFTDGNASAVNFSFTMNIDNCSFSSGYMVMEFYQAYCSSNCYFRGNLVSNMTGGGIAINGAVTNHLLPSFNITSNTFYQSGNLIIETTPANNLYITGNQFICTNGVTAIGLGSSGYQGTANNSNVVIAFNSFVNPAFAVQVLGAGLNSSINALICSNTAVGLNSFAYGYGWSTNISFVGNTGDGVLNSTQLQGQWYYDDLSNIFPFYPIMDDVGRTNLISYRMGARQQPAGVANSVFKLDDASPVQIPSNASMVITNVGKTASLFTSSIRSVAPINMTNGYYATFQWTNGQWRVTLASPTGLRVIPKTQ
jgi:hypothetical protein